jgi:transcription elongation factor GreB
MDDDETPRLTLDDKFYMTPTGHAQLREELATLMNVERPSVVKVVSWAAANGDRSENADYQFLVEDAIVVEPSGQSDRDRVFFGATVAYVGAFEGERTVTIVGVDEADMRMGKISLTAPIATALIKARARRGPAARYEDGAPVGSVSEPVDHRTEQGAHAVPCARRDE